MASTAKPKVKVAQGAVVCMECELVGEVTIGAKTVIHPKARIIAEAGPIIIGENNLIEEQAQIINRRPDNDTSDDGTQTVMIIGNNNVFEVDSFCEAINVGDNNVLEAKAQVGRQTKLTTGCIIGALCEVSSNEELEPNTIIYGSKCERRVQAERPPPQTLQLEFLTKILPNYHHLKKSSKLLPKVK